MSAVVHTGSNDAKSACGTKVIVLCASARTRFGIAINAAPANPDLSTSRRFMADVPCSSTQDALLATSGPFFKAVIEILSGARSRTAWETHGIGGEEGCVFIDSATVDGMKPPEDRRTRF